MKSIPFFFLLCMAGLASSTASPADTGDWRQHVKDKESKTLHTTDGGKHWIDVSPAAMTDVVRKQPDDSQGAEFLDGLVALKPLDGQRAWLAFPSTDWKQIIFEYTADGGNHWQQKTARLGVGDICIDFLDDRRGFLLLTGGRDADGRGVGQHFKRVYGTEDGGRSWRVLASPPGRSCIPTGITFRNPAEGWITASYRGDDYFPLYRTVDGGKSWQLQKPEIPPDYQGGYANMAPPVFTGKDKLKGYLPVHLVLHSPPPDHEAEVNYETEDGGATWHLPASGVRPTNRS